MMTQYELKNKPVKWWAERFLNCFPYTYPPELHTYEQRRYTIRDKFLWWPAKYAYYDKAICLRCNEDIKTGHVCKDIADYLSKDDLSN